MNKAYSANIWSESGLNNFELAHIFGHKIDERELEKKIFNNFDDSVKPFALFTSASNVVLIPKGLTKPTDKMDSIKICFYKRHFDLYGNNLYGIGELDEQFIPKWFSEIKWLEPILPKDWKSRIDNLLNYRQKNLECRYKKAYVQH